MDVENVASKSVANTALGLGIGGLSLALLDSIGGIGSILGGVGRRPAENEGDRPITRHEMELYNRISTLESQKYTDGAVAGINAQFAQQSTWNAVAMSNISVLQNQVGTLVNMTKTGIPTYNIISPFFPAPTGSTGDAASTSNNG